MNVDVPPIVLIEMVEEAVTVLPSFCQLKLVGEPEAVQVKVAVDPVVTVVAVGCWVMVGGDPAEEWRELVKHVSKF